MKRVLTTVAALLTAAAALPATAQVGDRASTASEDQSRESVVVQGQRKAVIQQLRNLIARNKSDQLARFESRVCPMVIGMPRDWTTIMARMIRENIESVGADVDKPGCKPNGLVIFIDQPVELVRALEKEEPGLLGMHPRTVANLIDTGGPAISWHVTQTTGADGEQLQSGTFDGVPGNFGGSTNAIPVTRGITSSRLYTPVRQDMMLAMVVIEKGRTEGKTLRQIADFATMHLLLEVKPSAAGSDPSSILSLFETRAEGFSPPRRLSRFDRGALNGFYAQRKNNLSSAQQRANIATAIEKGAGEDPTNR